MNKKNLLRYILCGILAAAFFLVAFALFRTWINREETFADGFKSILDWVLAVCFGCSSAYSLWKRDNKDNKKE